MIQDVFMQSFNCLTISFFHFIPENQAIIKNGKLGDLKILVNS